MQMKSKKTIWSTAVAAAATTTTCTVLFCSPSSGDNASSRNGGEQRHSFASAFAPFGIPTKAASLPLCVGSSSSPTGTSHLCGGSAIAATTATTRLSAFSTALGAATRLSLSPNVTYCKESGVVTNKGEGNENDNDNDKESSSVVVTEIPFDESVLAYDHYNGVTIHLDKYDQTGDDYDDNDDDSLSSSFAAKLNDALAIWKAEGRKGIWIHTNAQSAKYIPDCMEAGFQFHKILPKKTSSDTGIGNDNDNHASKADEEVNNNNSNNNNININNDNSLVLSRWLPTDTPSRLPHGPTHQVGVGVILFNPSDPSQMLVVKELSGPAAKYNLWKMPTGLVDPQEYVPEAASRELLEETGVEATMSGILCIRQAHRSNADTSDMFFVCKVTPVSDQIQWKRQEAEIADIRWMCVKEYCEQDHWQGSPLYETLNGCVMKASIQEQEHYNLQQMQLQRDKDEKDADRGIVTTGIEHRQLEVGFGRTDGKSEALFLLQQKSQQSSSITTTGSKL